MITFLLMLAGLPAALAQTPPDATPMAAPITSAPPEVHGVVAKVEIKGLRRIEEAVILDAIMLRKGDTLESWKVQRDIKAIWRTGYVEDVVVETEDTTAGVIVRFRIKEKPAVREVRISGNRKIKEDDLREVLDIEPFTVPSASRLAANAKALRDKYVEKGYFLVEVEPILKPVGDDLVELTFRITENRKVQVKQVDITGNDHIADSKIRRYMQTKAGGILPWLTNSGTFKQEALDNDLYVVRSVYLEEGYVDVQVDAPKVYLSPDKRFIYIEIHVTEGVQYQIGHVRVSGDFVAAEGLTEGAVRAVLDGKDVHDIQGAFERAQKEGTVGDDWVPDVKRRRFHFGSSTNNTSTPGSTGNLPLKTGDTFKLTTMQAAIQRVSDLYGDQGYAFANIVPLTQTDPESRVVDLTFDVQAGAKVRIGQVEISGNDPTFDKVVRREIPINEGDIYNGSALRDARARLERLGFFETVDINTPQGSNPDTLDITVDVSERPTGSFSVGAGYGSAESFLFTANIQKANFIGLGWLFSLNGNISARTRNGSISFYDPHLADSQWTLRVDGFYNERSYIENEYQRGGGLEVGRYLDERGDYRLAVNYTFEDVGLLSLDEYKERLYGGQMYRNGLTSSVGLSFDIDRRNNRINATQGFKLLLSSELAGGFRLDEDSQLNLFGGDFNYLESKLNFRFYQPLIPKGDWLIFRYNLSLGVISSTDGSIVPYIHRYRAGGITSIRGYEPYALGPSIRAQGYKDYNTPRSVFVGSDDPANADDRLVIGGTQTMVNNFELESPVVKAAGISLVTFFDAGNAFGDPWGNGGINLAELRTSVGFGVRWLSPIGPLRFEYGFPLNPYPDERKAVFDFTIGSAF